MKESTKYAAKHAMKHAGKQFKTATVKILVDGGVKLLWIVGLLVLVGFGRVYLVKLIDYFAK